jgi:hypothetical protein
MTTIDRSAHREHFRSAARPATPILFRAKR